MSSATTSNEGTSSRISEVEILQVNRSGIRVRHQDGSECWQDYGRVFKGEKLAPEDVGTKVTLTLVGKDFKWIKSIGSNGQDPQEVVDQEQPIKGDDPEGAPSSDPEVQDSPGDARVASENAIRYAKDLAREKNIEEEQLESVSMILFGKRLEVLDPNDASRLIIALGGYARTGMRQRS